MLRQLPGDLAFSFRLLRRRPAFTLLATACLALGIGANGAIFSLLNSLLLRTLPVHDPARLVVLHHGNDSRISYRDYHDIARRFEKSGSMLATLPTESSLDRAGYQGQLVTAEAVTANYSRVLQVGTALGDWFDNEDSPVAAGPLPRQSPRTRPADSLRNSVVHHHRSRPGRFSRPRCPQND